MHFYRGNLLAANIFFKRFRETKIEESLSYQVGICSRMNKLYLKWCRISTISLFIVCIVVIFRKRVDRMHETVKNKDVNNRNANYIVTFMHRLFIFVTLTYCNVF